MTGKDEKHHFILVHGFCHGAWCWFKLVSLLKQQGHTVTAVDLAASGVDPKQLHDISTISDYLQPLMEVMAALPPHRKVILVGHSYGGIPISFAMEKFPQKIAWAVFICAYMPNYRDPPALLIQEFFKRTPIESFIDSQITMDDSGKMPISGVLGPNYLEKVLYRHCTLEDLELGKTLMRPSLFFMEELGKTGLFSEDGYGKVRRCYVVCEEDEVVEEEFQRYMIANSPPERVVSIGGAAHMAMLTKPHHLCSSLLELAYKC